MVEKRDENPQVRTKHNGRVKKMTSSRRIVNHNGESQQRSGDLVLVDHDLIPVKQKAISQGPLDDSTNEVVRALTITRFSRLELLKGLAAAMAMATLPTLPGRSALAQTQTTNTTFDATGPAFMRKLFKDGFRRVTLIEGFGDHNHGSKALYVRESVAIGLTGLMYQQNPSADPLKVEAYVNAFRHRFDLKIGQGRSPGYEDLAQLKSMLDTAAEVVGEINPAGLFPVGKAISEIIMKLGVSRSIGNHMDSMAAQLGGQRQYDAYTMFSPMVEGILDDMLERAEGNAQYREAVNRILGSIGLPRIEEIYDATQKDAVILLLEKLAGDQDTQFLTMIEQMIHLDGSISGQIDTLKQEMQGQVVDRLKALLEGQFYIANQNSKLQGDVTRLLDAAAKAERDRIIALKRQEHEELLAKLSATVGLISTLIGFGDEKLGKQIQVVGNSFVQVYDIVWKFTDGVTNFSQFMNRALSMGGAIAAGNLVGVAMNLVSFFGSQAISSPEQIIQQQLAEIQQAIGRMHREMHERFDRIEQYLEAIYGGINSLFDMLNDRLDELARTTTMTLDRANQIQQQLVHQEVLLNRLTKTMHVSLEAGFRHSLNLAINEAIGYNERVEPMTASKFSELENELYTWAIDESKNALEMPRDGRGYEDEYVAQELMGTWELMKIPDPDAPLSRQLEKNIMYLSDWLTKRTNLPRLTDVPLVNPQTWHMSAEAYGQLRAENPKYASTAAYLQRASQVYAQGEQLSAALRRITVKGDGTPNTELFDWLIATNYKDKVDELDGRKEAWTENASGVMVKQKSLKDVESEVLNTWKTSAPPAGFGRTATDPVVDPWWGGAFQTIAGYTLTLTANPTPPNNLATFLGPYVLADYMQFNYNNGQSPLSVGYSSSWAGQEIEIVDFQPNEFVVRKIYSRLRVDVTVKYNGSPILVRHVLGDRILIRHEREWLAPISPGPRIFVFYNLDASTAFAQNWTSGQNLKFRFEQGGSQESSPPVIITDLVNKVEAKLRELQVDICTKILDKFASGAVLDIPARKLEGARALIDSFVSLGLPIAIESDDFLRALLYGTQSIAGLQQVKERYVRHQTQLQQASRWAVDQQPFLLNSYVSLRPFSYPAKYMRHRNFLGEVTEVQSELDKLDATFRVVPGFVEARDEAGNVIRPEAIDAVALESLNFPGQFLSHAPGDPRLKLKPFEDTPTFKEHATFSMQPGFANSAGVTFSALSDPHNSLYIHHTGSELWVHPKDLQSYPSFPKEATFYADFKNPWESIRDDAAHKRADALSKALKTYLTAISEQKHFESHGTMIDSTLLRSRVITLLVTSDTAPPETTLDPSGPTGTVKTNSARFIFSSPDADVASFECSLDGAPFETSTSPKDYTNLGKGQHTFSVRAVDKAGNVDPTPASRSWTIDTSDTQAPKVTSTVPASNATGVKRNANLTATFSEKMDPLSITKSTFKLFKVNADGSTTQITNVTVSKSTDGLKATLNPFGTSTTLLAKSTSYRAIVTTGAKDVAGNLLDQNSTTTGNQQKVWTFKTGLL